MVKNITPRLALVASPAYVPSERPRRMSTMGVVLFGVATTLMAIRRVPRNLMRPQWKGLQLSAVSLSPSVLGSVRRR